MQLIVIDMQNIKPSQSMILYIRIMMVILRGGKRDQVALKNMLFLYLNASEV